jgi:hypothetical protein
MTQTINKFEVAVFWDVTPYSLVNTNISEDSAASISHFLPHRGTTGYSTRKHNIRKNTDDSKFALHIISLYNKIVMMLHDIMTKQCADRVLHMLVACSTDCVDT